MCQVISGVYSTTISISSSFHKKTASYDEFNTAVPELDISINGKISAEYHSLGTTLTRTSRSHEFPKRAILVLFFPKVKGRKN